MNPVPIPAILDGMKSRKDGSWDLKIETAELHDDDKIYLTKLVNKQGYFYFAEAPFSQIVIPEVKLGEFETKTPSKQMHDVIYRLWEKSDRSKDPEDYYKFTMRKIIDQLKERLN